VCSSDLLQQKVVVANAVMVCGSFREISHQSIYKLLIWILGLQ